MKSPNVRKWSVSVDVGEGRAEVKTTLLGRTEAVKVTLAVSSSSSVHISSTSPCRKVTTRMHPAANSTAPRPKNSPLTKSSFSRFLNSSLLRSFIDACGGWCGLLEAAGSRRSGSSNEMRGSSSSSVIVMLPLLRYSGNQEKGVR